MDLRLILICGCLLAIGGIVYMVICVYQFWKKMEEKKIKEAKPKLDRAIISFGIVMVLYGLIWYFKDII